MSEWISVEERMPEDLPENKNKKAIKVIVCTKTRCNKIRTVKTMVRGRMYDFDHNWNWPGCAEVTHWMPLPEPPEEVEK